MVSQSNGSTKRTVEEKNVDACKRMLTFLLCAMNRSQQADLIVFDEGPTEQPEIQKDLQVGRIVSTRTTPPAHRLIHVWYVKGHFLAENEQTEEFLFGKFNWIDGVLLLAQRRKGEWHWFD